MLKLLLEDFKEEVKAEMYGYEEIEENLIDRWFEVFDRFISEKKKSSSVVYGKDNITLKFKDESDLFMIVDKYLAAVVNDELDNYFSNWSL